ncbi:hypothetical protein SAQ01S_08980 [Sphingomonas aquatilis NBRC 16722]|uniref:Uncharacterized protein n=1 Tax=Sphingomonas aquatilis TaxID=93063 RepID=A0AAW3TQC4_9SPHN|nr:hypothetical protein [Sphingomonas aquatilis]MBB3874824.1 hypothetical protein [Sphingomonas aquatilis]GEM71132.1 hypothetical protein SAQ01S_08980 [Sphingomonas aquatilis NBRC 16722]
MTAKRLAATYEGGDWDQAGAAMNEHHESPLVDFQYSAASVAFQNVAHGCWLAGICLPVVTKLLA